MATMGEALMAFNDMLDDVETWTIGTTSKHEQRNVNGCVERRDYDLSKVTQAIKAARAAIDGLGDEQAAVKMLLDVVQAAQWHITG